MQSLEPCILWRALALKRTCDNSLLRRGLPFCSSHRAILPSCPLFPVPEQAGCGWEAEGAGLSSRPSTVYSARSLQSLSATGRSVSTCHLLHRERAGGSRKEKEFPRNKGSGQIFQSRGFSPVHIFSSCPHSLSSPKAQDPPIRKGKHGPQPSLALSDSGYCMSLLLWKMLCGVSQVETEPESSVMRAGC